MMENATWVAFGHRGIGDAEVAVRPVLPANRDDGGGAVDVQLSVSGVWTGSLGGASAVEVPGATTVETEGAPRIPVSGLLVALPAHAGDVHVEVVSLRMQDVDLDTDLMAAPKQLREREFLSISEPDPAIYDSAEPYPGRVVDLIGVREVEGVRVAQLRIYLGQYRPTERRLEMVSDLVLRVHYLLGDSAATGPVRVSPATASLIHGLDLVLPSGTSRSASDAEPSADAAPEGGQVSPGTGEAAADAAVLRTPGNYAAYVVVTTPALADAVAPLLAANSPSRVARTGDITAEFPAASLEQSIHDFVGWAWANWTPVKPQYLVLAGDTEVIPIHLYPRGGTNYASDNYYVDETGDLAPEMVVSRIPISDATTLAAACQRMVGYRKLRADGVPWSNKVMVAAYQDTVYETCADQLADSLGKIYEVTKRYAKETDRAALLATLNNGVCLALYRGHGSRTEWSASNGLRAADVSSLSTDNCPPFLLDICCENGWVDDPAVETLTEALIRQGKALAVLSASRDSWTYPNNDFAQYLVDAVLRAGLSRPGDMVKYAKMRMMVEHPTTSEYADNLVMYNLFGDPTANVASNVDHLLGAYTMDHDGWQGLLRIDSVYGMTVAQGPGGAAPVWRLSGSYTGRDGTSVAVSGSSGGLDPNYEGGTARRSDNRIDLMISFPTAQRFVGYLHSRNRNEMSGYTWWAQIPFGWTARRLHTVLTSPTPTAPADGVVFSTYPRTTTVQWAATPGADQYLVEVQYGWGGNWYSEQLTVCSGTVLTFNHVGAQPGRWRVSARDSLTGRYGQSGPSPWRTFRYTV